MLLLKETINSLPESYATINIPEGKSFWKKLWSFSGPGLMVAVGYMDPGNWATDIAGGSKFGYALLSVILFSNLFAMLLQHLSLKLGIVTGRDLAQACKDSFSKPITILLWFFCEIAIAACDLAEVIGSAIALNLLFGLPLTVGVLVTILDIFIILYFQKKGFRVLESVVAGLVFVIFICFGYEIFASRPDVQQITFGLLPKSKIITDPNMLYLAIGILGATVMPHNLYLHSSVIQTRNYKKTIEGKREAIKFGTIDSNFSLFIAFLINASILIVSASAFFGKNDVADIVTAHHLLDPVLGVNLAGIIFAIALLASGQNSTITGTLAGQIVMEGFLNLKLKPWLRRLITRSIAIVPAFFITIYYGEKGTTNLLVFSQVILSIQLSFAVVPLVMFTSSKSKMGEFTNSTFLKIIASIVATLIAGFNFYLLYYTFK